MRVSNKPYTVCISSFALHATCYFLLIRVSLPSVNGVPADLSSPSWAFDWPKTPPLADAGFPSKTLVAILGLDTSSGKPRLQVKATKHQWRNTGAHLVHGMRLILQIRTGLGSTSKNVCARSPSHVSQGPFGQILGNRKSTDWKREIPEDWISQQTTPHNSLFSISRKQKVLS
jgi:hypothetical protein